MVMGTVEARKGGEEEDGKKKGKGQEKKAIRSEEGKRERVQKRGNYRGREK